MIDKKEVQPVGTERESVVDQGVIAESPRKKESNLEVESWMEKIEKRFARIPKGVPGPQDDEVIVQQSSSQQPPVKLPVTKAGMKKGKRAPVETGIAWLVAWVMRRIKQLSRIGQRVMLKDIPEIKQ